MSDADTLATVAREAKILHEAAEILENLDGMAEDMVEEGEMDDETDLRDDIGNATETCNRISTAMTLALAKNGVVPDFGAELFDEEDVEGDDEPGPSAFA